MPSSACSTPPATSPLSLHDALPILEHAHVVGHDWGAGVAWVLAMTAPERVDRLVVLSVGHPNTFRDQTIEQREKSWYMLLFQFGGVDRKSTRLNSSHITISYAVFCLFYAPRDLPSFPTRRSSDLGARTRRRARLGRRGRLGAGDDGAGARRPARRPVGRAPEHVPRPDDRAAREVVVHAPLPVRRGRSEEHTSELQSHHDLVCRLLLVLRPPRPPLFPYTTLFRSWSTHTSSGTTGAPGSPGCWR